MRVKGYARKAKQPPIQVVMVKSNGSYITHIYRSREYFKRDELARYKQKVFQTVSDATSSFTKSKNKGKQNK